MALAISNDVLRAQFRGLNGDIRIAEASGTLKSFLVGVVYAVCVRVIVRGLPVRDCSDNDKGHRVFLGHRGHSW